MKNVKKIAKGVARQIFNDVVLNATRKAQEKYNFDMTKKGYSVSNTHNNEADAFKHAYMSWHLSCITGGGHIMQA